MLQGCTATPELGWEPTFFISDQAKLITRISDIILPETDTPSASSLGVPGFIESIVSKVMDGEEQFDFMSKMDVFEKECVASTGSPFNELTEEGQMAFVTEKHAEIEGKSLPSEERPFIWKLKELVIAGYFTTEVGATQVLQYIQIPAEYKACISVEEAGGKTWAI